MTSKDFTDFSLLYPDAESKRDHAVGKKVPYITEYILDELGLLELFDLKNTNPADYFTTDPKVMEYRMEAFRDMTANPILSTTLKKLIPLLSDILELRRLDADSGDTNSYLSSITEIELYISTVEVLHAGLAQSRKNLKSQAFIALADRIAELAESDYYIELNEKLNALTSRVRDIKSVTIGVNLDTMLRPSQAGVLSVNAEPFRSGEALEKILRLNFKDDEYTCIASLVPFGKKQSENQKTALATAFNSAINDVYKSSLRSWKRIVQEYVLDNTDFLLDLMPEIEFLVKGTEFLKKLMDKGFGLCIPEIAKAEERLFIAKDLYNANVAVKIDGEIVPNDVEFDDRSRIYVLTGPNRGGKSVITCAIGQAQAMMQLGMYVPAKSAKISPVDAVYTHFTTGAEDTIDKGRLGEECARLREIFDRVTPESLVLLDESFSSTGSYEAAYIAAEVLTAFSKVNCKCLFATHLHELASRLDEINERAKSDGGGYIDSLVAGIENKGVRSFKIYKAKPDGKSYARDIAMKYGLTYENMTKRFK